MNLRTIANRVTSRINPNVAATLRRSTGYTKGASYDQIPTYSEEPIVVQVQALTQKELQHLEKMNISNGQASVFANRQLSSADRSSQSGGDIIVFGTDVATPEGLRGQTWLVVALLEGWIGSGWCKAAITSQMTDPTA
ncbi:hypothetical protein [Novosphingobium olei]|uniref:Uncharacterized protein n=1 Tax=Novosphingobium olei TaxID=2728851 RepID=A0A7Y0GAN5_9SPHN|nr:hypothetical protein [Novosphingobium olei]NML93802.1 hypothetical protein [Novosphingobium olei]